MAKTKRRFNFYSISAVEKGRKKKRVIRTKLSLSQVKRKFIETVMARGLTKVVIRKITEKGAVRLIKKSGRRRRFISGKGKFRAQGFRL